MLRHSLQRIQSATDPARPKGHSLPPASQPLRRPLCAQAAPRRVRSWAAREEWLGLADFSNMLHSPPYSSMLNCDSWRPASPLVFPSSRHQNKAVCAVEVLGRARTTYTFCLEKMSTRGGPLWLTVGVRVGDYGNV